jgi:AcrB/AcrD/AcrF family
MVEFANHLQETGLSKLEAIIGGASTRLRPILMTTAATVFGHFPLVLATGPGAGARNSIGIMLVSGMIIGTNGKTARIAIHSKGRIRLLGSEGYMGSKCHFRKKNGSRCGANAQWSFDHSTEVLLAAGVPFCRLYRGVARLKLALFEFASTSVAEARSSLWQGQDFSSK